MRCYQFSVPLVLATINLSCLATPFAPRWDDLSVKHSWSAVPAGWESLGLPPASTTIDIHVGIKPHVENALIAALYEVSSPSHPKYGAHLSKKQVAELVMPHPDTLGLVHSWLGYHGVPSSSISVTHGGNWLTLTGVSVSKANELLGASYQLYRHAETNETTIRTVGYSLPVALHAHVQTVAPTTYFASLRAPWRTHRKRSDWEAAGPAKAPSRELVLARSGPNNLVTPAFLRWLYKSFAYEPAATDRNVLGVAGYSGDYPSPADLVEFMSRFRSDGAEANFSVVQVNDGGYDPDNPSLEANLDIQYSEAMAYPTPHIFYSTGEGPPGADDPYLSWLRYVLNQANIPQTISTSYANYENSVPPDYARAMCNLFAQLGARGVSVLFASGDFGVGDGNCGTDGNVRFMPTFPAACPWVTSVGGTTGHEPEVAANLASGGFSDYFPRPNYQDEAVSTFFQNLGNKYHGFYNASGRGFPDIAAQALGYVFVFQGKLKGTQGTSCAAPTVAGVISLLNDFRLSKGKPPLGFLNPWLYGSGRAGLNDITSGSNPGCNTDGFPAIDGWDPVTGFGTPDFDQLQSLASH